MASDGIVEPVDIARDGGITSVIEITNQVDQLRREGR